MENKKIIKSTFPKYYYLTRLYEGDDRHYTVCAKVERVNDTNLLYKTKACTADGAIDCILPMDGHYMKLTMGWAICSDDTYSKAYGQKLAKSRLKKRKIAELYSPYNGEFKEDVVRALMDVKCQYIHDHIDHFLPKENTYEISVDLGSEEGDKTVEIVVDTKKKEGVGAIITSLVENASEIKKEEVIKATAEPESEVEPLSLDLKELKEILERI